MTIPSNPSELFTPFLPTTYNLPEEEDRSRVFLVDRFSNFADVINDKRIGNYAQAAENFNGTKWGYGSTRIVRNGYQAIAFIPSLPNAGSITLTATSDPAYPVPNVNGDFVVTQVWGSASRTFTDPDPSPTGNGDYFSFFSEGDSRISFTMTNKQIVITTTTDLSAYIGLIIVEYIRNGK